MIRTRDIIFNKQEFFSRDEIDLTQLIKEPFIYDTLDIPHINMSHLITDISSDSEEEEEIVLTPKASSSPKEVTKKVD